jgi:hypothetical protein
MIVQIMTIFVRIKKHAVSVPPGLSSAGRIAKSLDTVSEVTASVSSARRIVVSLTDDARARSSASNGPTGRPREQRTRSSDDQAAKRQTHRSMMSLRGLTPVIKDGNRQQGQKLCARPADISTDVL